MYVDIGLRRTRDYIHRLGLILAMTVFVGAKPAQKRIDLDVRDADIHNVLRLLADTGRTNIVIPEDVKGRVTIKLRHVPWTDALAVVLRAHGLGQERSGNIIYVDTLERLAKASAARAERRQARVALAPLVTVRIILSYANAEAMVPIVRSLLTDRGKVTVDRRHNALIVTDVRERIDAVRSHPL